MRKFGCSSIYLIAIGAFSLGMASYVTAGLIPMIETSFSVSIAVAAQLVTAFTLAYGLGSPIADRHRPASSAPTALQPLARTWGVHRCERSKRGSTSVARSRSCSARRRASSHRGLQSSTISPR